MAKGNIRVRSNPTLKRNPLEQKLRTRFKDRRLLEQALVHPSYLNEAAPDQRPAASYERLEFLGDAVLGASVASELFRRCPQLDEGELTKMRSSLVRGRALAKISRELGLGAYLKLGKGEEATGGYDRDSILAAVLEALVGAVYTDKGFEPARKFVLNLLGSEIEASLSAGVPEDPKSRLQERVQQSGGAPPEYRLISTEGPDHARHFEVEVILDGQPMGRGWGQRKLDAEKQAAVQALDQLASTPDR